MRYIQFAFPFILLILFSSCQFNKPKPEIAEYFSDLTGDSLSSSISIARGFDLYHWEGIDKVVVYHPELLELVIGEYYITSEEIAAQFNESENTFTRNSDSVAVFSATQLNAFDKLGILDKIVGVSEAEYIINEAVKDKINNGEVVELAGSGNYFVERTITVNPQLIFFSPYKVTDSHALDVTGIPLIPFFDYFETDPLGRAEWIKFTAVFFGKTDQANEFFTDVVKEYTRLRSLTLNEVVRPTIFSDKYFNGQWYIPGGQSYIARLFKDAGAHYLWRDDQHTASFPLDYEVVFGMANDADFWRIVGSYGDTPSYAGLEEENGLYKHFKAFQDKHVIYCNARESAYFENSPLEPHLILADLIYIFHPHLLPGHQPAYYYLLK